MSPQCATGYERNRLRCNLCGEVFAAPAPSGVGEVKEDASAVSMDLGYRAATAPNSLIVDQAWAKDCAWTCGQRCCSSKSTIGRPPKRRSIPTSRDSTRL